MLGDGSKTRGLSTVFFFVFADVRARPAALT